MLEFTEEEFIGCGGFSNVYRVTVGDGKVYALKKIHSHLLKDPTNKTAIIKEIEIMSQIDHPNIVKFHSHIENSQYEISLLLQFVQGGNLYNLLKQNGKFTEQKTIKCIKDIIKALKYLHSRPNPILHRDIKPQNILINKSGQCKLADFGSSNLLDGQRNTYAGTQQYMAPQIVQGKSYGKQVDLWCLGLLIYELLLGQLSKQRENYCFPLQISKAAQDVIKRLLNNDPQCRMTLQQLENHVWLAEEPSIISLTSQKSQQNLLTKEHYQKRSVKQRLKNLQQTKKAQQQQKKRNILKNQETSNNQFKNQINDSSRTKNLQRQKDSSQQQNIIQEIKLKCSLKMKIQQNKQRILQLACLPQYRLLKQQQLLNLAQKLKRTQKHTEQIQRNVPQRIEYQYQNTIRSLLKKIDYFNQFVEYFPQKLIEETTEMPQNILNTKMSKIHVDSNLIKLRTSILQIYRDALLENIQVKKKLKALQISC